MTLVILYMMDAKTYGILFYSLHCIKFWVDKSDTLSNFTKVTRMCIFEVYYNHKLRRFWRLI